MDHLDETENFIILENDFTYNAVVSDIRKRWPTLKVGGCMLIPGVVNLEQTNINGVYKAIQQCILEHTMEAKLVDQPGTSQVYERIA